MRSSPFEPTFGASPLLLVGRDDQLDEFASSLETGGRGPGRATLYVGLRGVGKTGMLNAVEEEADPMAGRVDHSSGHRAAPARSGAGDAARADHPGTGGDGHQAADHGRRGAQEVPGAAQRADRSRADAVSGRSAGDVRGGGTPHHGWPAAEGAHVDLPAAGRSTGALHRRPGGGGPGDPVADRASRQGDRRQPCRGRRRPPVDTPSWSSWSGTTRGGRHPRAPRRSPQSMCRRGPPWP